jgi:hypothetical protein
LAARNAKLKFALARQYGRDAARRHDYVASEEPFIWATMRAATSVCAWT